MNDLDLLRRYEPVVRYTEGEMFFPCAVDAYLARCRLWMADAARTMTLLAAPGELTTAALAEFRSVPREHRLFLQFVDGPLTALDYQRWARRPERVRLPSPNRLQRIGLPNRILDGVFALSLLVRGSVPGGVAAAIAADVPVVVPRSAYFAHATIEGAIAIGPGLHTREGWRPALAGSTGGPVTLDDLQAWHQEMDSVSQFG